jgi:hypothetical protein
MEALNLKLVVAIVLLAVLVYMAFRERARRPQPGGDATGTHGDQFFRRCPPPS